MRPPITRTVQDRTVQTGAVFYVTQKEAIERGRPTNEGIFSLAKDAKDNLVYQDPVVLNDRVAQLDASEEKYKDSGFKPDADYIATKAKLVALTKRMTDRAKKAGPEATKTQIEFSNNFFGFKDHWDEFYDDVQSSEFDRANLGGNALLDVIDTYDKEYRTYVVKYTSMGFKPSNVPEASKVGNTFPDLGDVGSKVGVAISGLVTPLVILGGLVVGGLVVYNVSKPSPKESKSA